jgi:hypothetical protein
MGIACGKNEAEIVEVDHDYDFLDRRTGHMQIAALDQGALHSIDVGNLHHHESHAHSILEAVSKKVFPPFDERAGLILRNARELCQVVDDEKDILHNAWHGPDGKNPLLVLTGKDSLSDVASELIYLADGVQRIVASEPTITEADAPCKVFGDIHGHFRDLLLLLHDFGFPSGHGPTYIFNGDWVDRGKHQLEVVCLLFALKMAYPHQVRLNRGNHEDSAQNSHMGATGFLDMCQAHLGSHSSAVYDKISTTFEWLPLGCIVSNKILVVHGGIGDGNWEVEDVQPVARPLSHDALASHPVLYNMLWSDPLAEDGCNGFGVHDSPRDNHGHLVKSFGQDITESFLARNDLEMVIRSHEARPQGCGYEVMHSGKCLRVFSARDYEGMKNDGAILSITQESHALIVRPQVLRSLCK